ncbi:MAG: hypothetical protein JNM88_00925 [Chitinophagaceae bacterium]|nr:hypothetical protein [Chitinophagaceae bacterium]
MKYILFIGILALRLSYQPSSASQTPLPFASPEPVTVSANNPARLIEFNGTINNNKVVLNWIVAENETADQFEVEKSTDGVNFKLTALVFGTDKPAKDNYAFFEKAGNQKVLYRIKIIDKNKKAAYSPIVEINPAA